jgi:hypothetical protein
MWVSIPSHSLALLRACDMTPGFLFGSQPCLGCEPKVRVVTLVVLWRSVWMNKCLSFFLVPSQSSNTPLYPPKVLWARERAPTSDSLVVFTLDSHLSLSKSLGTSQNGFFMDNLSAKIAPLNLVTTPHGKLQVE